MQPKPRSRASSKVLAAAADSNFDATTRPEAAAAAPQPLAFCLPRLLLLPPLSNFQSSEFYDQSSLAPPATAAAAARGANAAAAGVDSGLGCCCRCRVGRSWLVGSLRSKKRSQQQQQMRQKEAEKLHRRCSSSIRCRCCDQYSDLADGFNGRSNLS